MALLADFNLHEPPTRSRKYIAFLRHNFPCAATKNRSAVLFPVVNIDQQIEYPDRFSLTHIDPKRRLGGHIAVNESAICWGEQVLSSRSMGLLHSFFVISYKFRLG